MPLDRSLLFVSNVADVLASLDKDYRFCCDYCLSPDFPEWPDIIHCYKCHENLGDRRLYELHRNGRTGGCRYPGNLGRFYEMKYGLESRVWLQKPDPDEKRNQD